MTATERKTCRACDGTDLVSVLDLGNQPLANGFVTEDKLEWQEPDFPLHMVRCTACGLCQLTHVVDPEVLYRDYKYESGHSEGWKRHCEALADEIAARYPAGFVLDIAANDGTLLRICRDRGLRIHGVDPARITAPPDVPILNCYWPIDMGQKYEAIVAQNVFGHVDDARGFLQGIAKALAGDGVAIIECPSVVDLVHAGRWDTIYHEHLSYWSTKPMAPLARSVGMHIEAVAYFPDLHGGTVRYYLRHGTKSSFEILEGAWGQVFEANKIKPEDFDQFAIRALADIQRWNEYLQNPQGLGIAGYGAAAKMNTFLNALPDRPKLVGIFDDNPRKHRLYTPGWHFPVLRPTEGVMMAVDEILIGAPNWKDGILAKAESLGFKGEVKTIWS